MKKWYTKAWTNDTIKNLEEIEITKATELPICICLSTPWASEIISRTDFLYKSKSTHSAMKSDSRVDNEPILRFLSNFCVIWWETYSTGLQELVGSSRNIMTMEPLDWIIFHLSGTANQRSNRRGNGIAKTSTFYQPASILTWADRARCCNSQFVFCHQTNSKLTMKWQWRWKEMA